MGFVLVVWLLVVVIGINMCVDVSGVLFGFGLLVGFECVLNWVL